MSHILRHRVLLILAAAAIVLKLFSGNELWVEQYYTFGVYPFLSGALRALFGWIPFSVGDIFYVAAGALLIYSAVRLVRSLTAKNAAKAQAVQALLRVGNILLIIYLAFNILWGLNYNRRGIATQLALNVAAYSHDDLSALVRILQQRICTYGDRVDSVRRSGLNNNDSLLSSTLETYARMDKKYSFLQYRYPSVKSSLLSPLGPYFGFTGYYNPFTAEAQINTAVPFFVKPFVAAHEIAHQLGYAKENEANFVSYLVLQNAADPEWRYSVYFEMYAYALNELGKKDPVGAWLFVKTAHPQYSRDYAAYVAYLTANKNRVEPFISKFYDRYLKLNNQPAGKQSYNLVVAWLIAYMKKHGELSV